MPMTPERWQQIEKLFHAALELNVRERAAFLEEACGNDESLRREVESLLGQKEKPGFMTIPVVDQAIRLIAADEDATGPELEVDQRRTPPASRAPGDRNTSIRPGPFPRRFRALPDRASARQRRYGRSLRGRGSGEWPARGAEDPQSVHDKAGRQGQISSRRPSGRLHQPPPLRVRLRYRRDSGNLCDHDGARAGEEH